MNICCNCAVFLASSTPQPQELDSALGSAMERNGLHLRMRGRAVPNILHRSPRGRGIGGRDQRTRRSRGVKIPSSMTVTASAVINMIHLLAPSATFAWLRLARRGLLRQHRGIDAERLENLRGSPIECASPLWESGPGIAASRSRPELGLQQGAQVEDDRRRDISGPPARSASPSSAPNPRPSLAASLASYCNGSNGFDQRWPFEHPRYFDDRFG
jgi:hypothetical protein